MKLCALALLTALLALLQKGKEWGIFIALAGLAALTGVLAEPAGELLTFLRTLAQGTGLESGLFSPLYQVLGISLAVRLGSQLCRDAGESALAAGLETAGCVAALLASLPLLQRTLMVLEELMTG